MLPPSSLAAFRRCAWAALSTALIACGDSAPPGGATSTVPTLDAQAPAAELPVRTGLAGRLTRAQHANIMLDVLGLELTVTELSPSALGIPQEQASTGLFSNGADGQAAADDYPLAFGKLAAAIAARVDLPTLTAPLAGCGEQSDACRSAFVEYWGQRLFRRPLSEREALTFSGLHAAVIAEGLSFDEALRSVLEAMLQAPAFVFRLERETAAAADEKRYLDGFELASRLSFFLWNSAPDAELLAAAAADTLNGSAAALPVLREQVARMLTDPRARRMTRAFITDFAQPERANFIGVTPELRLALLESMVASFEHHLWTEQGQIEGLFTSTTMSFEPSVAGLLGLTPSGPGQQLYDVSMLPERVGWLTHPGFIAGVGDADVGKIVHRGITLMVKLMCREPAQIPDAVAASATEFSRTFATLTERQRSEERQLLAKPVAEGGSNNPSCWGCHAQFEPLAYGFDRFDAAGRYLGEVDAAGRPLPIDGWLTDDLSVEESARKRYANVAELMQLLAESETVQACLSEHFIAFATGRASSAIEKEFSFDVRDSEQAAGGTLHAMVDAITQSEVFRALASAPVSNEGMP